jgi:hypothetical protein
MGSLGLTCDQVKINFPVGLRSTFQTALVATLDTYDFILNLKLDLKKSKPARKSFKYV